MRTLRLSFNSVTDVKWSQSASWKMANRYPGKWLTSEPCWPNSQYIPHVTDLSVSGGLAGSELQQISDSALLPTLLSLCCNRLQLNSISNILDKHLRLANSAALVTVGCWSTINTHNMSCFLIPQCVYLHIFQIIGFSLGTKTTTFLKQCHKGTKELF